MSRGEAGRLRKAGPSFLLGVACLLTALYAEEFDVLDTLLLVGLAAAFFVYGAVLWRAHGPGERAR